MTTTTYDGSVQSALRRVRRVLLRAGFPQSKIHGRYHAFGPAQAVTEGFTVSRVGCSDSISLHWRNQRHTPCHEEFAAILKAVRDDGLPFKDNGWMDCARYDQR